MRLRGASAESDRWYTCNQPTGIRPNFFSRYLNARPLFVQYYYFFSFHIGLEATQCMGFYPIDSGIFGACREKDYDSNLYYTHRLQ